MNLRLKVPLRESIRELAEGRFPREMTTDDYTNSYVKGQAAQGRLGTEGDLYDSVTLLGAQLSRPPYDPYREPIDLTTDIGRNPSTRITLDMPIIVYSTKLYDGKPIEAVHYALNQSAKAGATVGIIGHKRKDRAYPYFARITDSTLDDAEGFVFGYQNSNEGLRKFEELRRATDLPILVSVGQLNDIPSLLQAGADGILLDTQHSTRVDGNVHPIGLIRRSKIHFDNYYRGKENDGAALVVGGIYNSGDIVKSVALGASSIGYFMSILLALSHHGKDETFDVDSAAERIYRHLQATKGELRGLSGCLGYSHIHNISPADMRTSSKEASRLGDIPLEGIDMTYKEVVQRELEEFLTERQMQLSDPDRQLLLDKVLRG